MNALPESTTQELATLVPDDVLDHVAQEIRTLQREATLGFAMRIGHLIIENLYGGDLEAWRHRGPKDLSFRKLTERLPDISSSYIYRAVAVYEMDQRIGGVSASKHLGMSHVQMVLALPDKEQKRILKTAEEKEWTVREIEDAVTKVRRKLEPGTRGGRPALPVFVKSLHFLQRYAENEELLTGDLDSSSISGLDKTERKTLTKTITVLQKRLEHIRKRLTEKTEEEDQE